MPEIFPSTIWMWQDASNSSYSPGSPGRFLELPCRRPTFQHLLVALGAKTSPSQAQKSLERGEVRWRRNYQEPWQKVQNFNQELLEGWPFEVRWTRQYLDGHAQILRPRPYQGRRFWAHLMPGGPEGSSWLAYWLDKLEGLHKALRTLITILSI